MTCQRLKWEGAGLRIHCWGCVLRQNLPCPSLLYVSSVRRCLINTYCVPGDGVDVRLALLWQHCSGGGLQGQGGLHCQLCHASAESPGRQLSQPQVSSLGSKATCEGVGTLLRIRADTVELACWQVLSQRLL